MLENLVDIWGERFRVLAGPEYFEASTVTRVDIGPALRKTRNLFFLKRRLLLQPGTLSPGIRAEVVILELNPRIMNTWIIAGVRRALRRPVVMWGHAWPRQGRHSRTDGLRQLQRRLADVIIVYTEAQARELEPVVPGVQVIAAPNALYPAAMMHPATPSGPVRDLIFVGRLVAAKKPLLALDAFARAVPELPAESRLHIVGDGPLRTHVEQFVNDSPVLRDRVVVHGHVGARDVLEPLFLGSVASLIPGFVGLSVTQSLSFGVPVIYARDEPHSPEIEAVTPPSNAVEVPSDDPSAMAAAIADCVREADDWLGRRAEIAAECAANYSVEHMAARIAEAAALAVAQFRDPAPGRSQRGEVA